MIENRMFEICDMKYECVYSPESVERLKELVEADYCAEDCLDFIDKYGEQDFLEYYDLFIDFQEDVRYVNTQILIDYYSGFSFLDLEFYGEYKTQESFIERYYELDTLPPVIIIDWEKTFGYIKELFDFIPTDNNSFYIFGK